MRAKDRVGQRGERLAEAYLDTIGFTVLDRNWRGVGGELDLVALDGDVLVAVEVKARSSWAFGHPFEAVDGAKLARIVRLAAAWARENGQLKRARRVDVVAVTGIGRTDTPLIEHLRGVA
ncbi:YraN family protein [Sinomonas sp. ASV322]|uniref:YraN family protein n=1 Tax=Sinomonas sp. ASV322 TaxID=3041920 RepID=UPI0027DD3E29|nr:YraN family protein [Sinomonas sp. ASV322]MDQ4502270.1 YraN family protein [Sinomonas sp. ASV322]